jgi:hypothetical protein
MSEKIKIKIKLRQYFDKALKKNDVNKINKLLLNKKTPVSYEDNFAAYYACEYGFYDIFNSLFKSRRIKIRSMNNFAFVSACNGGYYKIVDLFLNFK